MRLDILRMSDFLPVQGQDIRQPSLLETEPERCADAVAGVGDHDRRLQLPLGECVQQAERETPLLLVHHVLGDACPAAAVGLVRPLPRQIQLPLQGARGGVGGGMDTHCDLAVRPFADRSAVLAGHPDRGHAALGERHVVDHPHLGPDDLGQPLGDPLPDRQRIPRRLVHELLQGLHVPVRQTLDHRLDRLAPTVEHQTSQITLTPGPLIRTRHRGEDIRHKHRQRRPQSVHFMRIHTTDMLLISINE